MSIRALALYTKITHTCLNASQSTGKRRAATEGIAAVILQGRTFRLSSADTYGVVHYSVSISDTLALVCFR